MVLPAGNPATDARTVAPTTAGLLYARSSFWTGADVSAAGAGAGAAEDAGFEQETLRHVAPASASSAGTTGREHQRIEYGGPSAANAADGTTSDAYFCASGPPCTKSGLVGVSTLAIDSRDPRVSSTLPP